MTYDSVERETETLVLVPGSFSSSVDVSFENERRGFFYESRVD